MLMEHFSKGGVKMQIDEQFLIKNNITKEEYEEYYNSLEMPKIEKSVNEFGLITLVADDIAISFREGYMSESEAAIHLENDYRKSKTEVHFVEITRKKREEKEKEREEELILSETDEAIFSTNMNVEYLVILQELGM